MAIALKTAAGKFLKNSNGKFLSKFKTQYADDKNITMTLRNGSKLMIDTTYIYVCVCMCICMCIYTYIYIGR